MYASSKAVYNHSNQHKQCGGKHIEVTLDSYRQFSLEFEVSEYSDYRFRKPRNDKSLNHKYPNQKLKDSTKQPEENGLYEEDKTSSDTQLPILSEKDFPENVETYGFPMAEQATQSEPIIAFNPAISQVQAETLFDGPNLEPETSSSSTESTFNDMPKLNRQSSYLYQEY